MPKNSLFGHHSPANSTELKCLKASDCAARGEIDV
jgi:hypothetical protein